MLRHPEVETVRLVELYSVGHLTVREIGKLVGISHAAVWKRLKAAGVRAEEGTHVRRECAFCGTEVLRIRSLARRSRVYCSAEHYYADLERSPYREWRQGGRLARAVVAQHFALDSEHVVHHKDGDQRNNDLANLAVYESQAEHMRVHRGGKAAVLWDGATVERRAAFQKEA